MSEPSLRDQLIADYLQHEDAVEVAASAELWTLGDWLVQYVPNTGRGRPSENVGQPTIVTLADMARCGRRSRSQLQDLRKIAGATAPDRLPKVTVTAYYEALRYAKWDLMAANKSLCEKGHRKRDQREGPHESVSALKRELSKRTPEDRAEVARELASDPTVSELLDGMDPRSFGAEWANALVLRVHENACRLSALVKSEGLRFAPSTSLAEMHEYLFDAECQIAEQRAAVGERMREEQGVRDAQ